MNFKDIIYDGWGGGASNEGLSSCSYPWEFPKGLGGGSTYIVNVYRTGRTTEIERMAYIPSNVDICRVLNDCGLQA